MHDDTLPALRARVSIISNAMQRLATEVQELAEMVRELLRRVEKLER